MIIVNTETIPGKRIVEVKGLVQGNTVRAKNVGRDIAASFKNLVGGELKGYTELLVESRREAVARMLAQAGRPWSSWMMPLLRGCSLWMCRLPQNPSAGC